MILYIRCSAVGRVVNVTDCHRWNAMASDYQSNSADLTIRQVVIDHLPQALSNKYSRDIGETSVTYSISKLIINKIYYPASLRSSSNVLIFF